MHFDNHYVYYFVDIECLGMVLHKVDQQSCDEQTVSWLREFVVSDTVSFSFK